MLHRKHLFLSDKRGLVGELAACAEFKKNQQHPGATPKLGTIQGGEFEKFYPKPSTWVRMSGIPRKFGDLDVKDMLKVALEDDKDESIVQVEQRGDGSVYVQFAKVWEARGCGVLLDGNDKLFGEKIGVKLWHV